MLGEMRLKETKAKLSRAQNKVGNFFHKKPDSKHLGLCGLHGSFSTTVTLVTVVRQKAAADSM